MSELLKSVIKNESTLSKSNLKIAPGAVVCLECELKGDITIGKGTVVHPRSRIIAEAGPIIIGEYNMIEELAEIINAHSDTEKAEANQTVMIIGNNNVFEVDSYCAALQVGDNNIIESKGYVGPKAELSNGCIIGAMCYLNQSEKLAENTVIYGSNNCRRVQLEKPTPQIQQLDFLAKILPNYHHIRKPTKSTTSHMPLPDRSVHPDNSTPKKDEALSQPLV